MKTWIKQFCKLMLELKLSGDQNFLEVPEDLKNEFKKFGPRGRQEDAQQFFLFLMDKFTADTGSDFGFTSSCVIKQTCPDCKEHSIILDRSLNFFCKLEKETCKQTSSIQDEINLLFRPEEVTEFKCSKCSSIKVRQNMGLEKERGIPDFLWVCISPFHYEKEKEKEKENMKKHAPNETEKLKVKIQINQVIHVATATVEGEADAIVIYNLCGVVKHFGATINAGHYKTYGSADGCCDPACTHDQTNKCWREYNDQHVSDLMTIQEAISNPQVCAVHFILL